MDCKSTAPEITDDETQLQLIRRASVCITTLLRISKLNIKADVLYSGQPSVLWSTIEANVGIICACLPLMRSVVIYLVPWFANRTSSNRQGQGRAELGRHSDINENRKPHWGTDRKNQSTNRNDPYAITCIEDEDARSLSGGEAVMVEKIERAADVASAAGVAKADHETPAAGIGHSKQDYT